jgi:ABC-type lipoprotein export system ATPase subunit
MTTALALERVSKSFQDGERLVSVLRDADLAVKRGEFVAVVGPSGAGKSTLLHLAGGLDQRYTGTASVLGRNLAAMSDEERSAFRASSIGYVFQSFNLLPHFSVLENVLMPGYFGSDDADAERSARASLESLGLGPKAHRRPGELSGGERQRVALARALHLRPALLLADEPTGSLDQETGDQVLAVMRRLRDELDMTLVVVTHERRVSEQADRTLRLQDGRFVEVRP